MAEKNHENIGQDYRLPVRDFNLRPPEYEADGVVR
jgi:hypothetical protein